MRRKIDGMVVVITGASTGIGRATALALAKRRATVILTARREPILRAVAAQCEQLGGRALVAPADVTDDEAVRRVARQAAEAFGRIDVWINNAAVTVLGRFEDTPAEAYRRVIETNLFGYVHGARAVLPYFRSQEEGVLVNVASIVGKISQPFASAYAASKFGIIGLTESLRMELSEMPGIHVCAVLPGSVDTPLYEHAANYTGRALQPVQPVYSAEEVAETIIAAIRAPNRDIFVGAAPRVMAAFHNLLPRWFERVYTVQVETKHFRDSPAPASPGNLFQPMDGYDSASGGWRALPARRATGRAVAAGLGIGVGLLIVGRAMLGRRGRVSSLKRLPKHAFTSRFRAALLR
ncbi:MAG: SDR family oxidoreductase [Sulfurifustaceae bacterium]